MKKFTKMRLLSLVLCIAMIAGMIPASIVAAATSGSDSNSPATFVIKFNNRNAEGNITHGCFSLTATCGEPLTIPSKVNVTAYKRVGYTFTGWNSKIDGTGTRSYSDNETISAEDIDSIYAYLKSNGKSEYAFTAQYAANTNTPYKVQHLLLAADGVKVYKAHATYTHRGTTDTLTSARALTNIAGYTALPFDQVNINGNGTTMLKIYYKRNNYTLGFDLNGGSFTDNTSENQSVQYNSTITAPSDPVRPGYTFSGWAPLLPNKMPANDLTVTAQWEANTGTKYKVQHLLLAADGVKVYKAYATYTYKGTTDTLTSAVALTNIPGYTAKAFEQMNINGDGSTMVKIYYTRNNYTLTYDLAGGKFEDGTATTQTVQYLKKLSAPTEPVRAGYTFAGWSPSVPASMPAENVTLTAQWIANTNTPYKVQHLLLAADGVKVYKAYATYPYKGTTDTLTSAVALTNIPGFTAKAFEQMNINGDGSTMVKIYYTRNNYTLTYDLAGGTFTDNTVATQTVQYLKKLTAPADPTRAGYTFSGWAPVIPASMPANDLTIVAQWAANKDTKYTVNHILLAADDVSVHKVYESYVCSGTTDTLTNATALTTIPGYTAVPFVQTNINGDGSAVVDIYYKRNYYELKFDLDGGSFTDGTQTTQSVQFDSAITLPANPVKTGYTFEKWVPVLPSNMPAENLTVSAFWVANEYTVTFDAAGGAVAPGSKTVVFDSAIGDLPTPTRHGYLFLGWVDANGNEVTAATVYTTAANSTLTAKWELLPVVVVTATEGSTVVVKDASGNVLTAEADGSYIVTKGEYTYEVSKENYVTQSGKFTVDNANVTIKVDLVLVTYTVTYVVDGETYKTETVSHGSTVTMPEVPEKAGYTGAWDTVLNEITGDVTVTAVYTEIYVNPDTGDNAIISVVIAVISLTVAAGTMFGKRRRIK